MNTPEKERDELYDKDDEKAKMHDVKSQNYQWAKSPILLSQIMFPTKKMTIKI